MRRTACISCLLTATTACNTSGPQASSSFGTLPVTTGPAEGSSSSSSSSTSGGSTSPVHEDSTSTSTTGMSSGGTTLTLDVGMPDLGVPGPEGCGGKIDFLFVISSYFNMELVQAKLIWSFPAFIDQIESKFGDFDYQIMVVDGGQGWGNDFCNMSCDHPNCDVPDYPCDAVAELTACDELLGAGTIFNAGASTYNTPCPVAGERRYLVKGQPDLAGTFQCIARVGINGSGLLGRALASAVDPAKTGNCNQGFIRDDALLFVSIISYGVDSDFVPEPDEWAQAVIDAKHGDASAVVMFSIGPISGAGWTDLDSCAKDPQGTICRMMQYFPYRLLVDQALPAYNKVFAQATELVDEACSAFIPQ